MKPAEPWGALLVTMTMLLSGVALAVGRSSALSPDGAILVSDKKGASGMAPTHPTGDETKGEDLYNASCIVCHGPQGTGGIGPRLAGNPMLSNEQAFWKTVYDGRHVMPPLKGAVTEQQMADILAWLKTLR